MAEKPKAPPRLGADGRRLWHSIVDTFDLRPDELLVLEKACRTADDSARLDRALADGPLMVTGSTGQQRHNPLLHEARQTRALLAALLKLALPDEQAQPGQSGQEGRGSSPGSVKAMDAARARWGSGGRRGA